MKAADSCLFCVNREVYGIEVTVIRRWIEEEYAGERRGRMAVLEREIRSKTVFPAEKIVILKSPYYRYFLILICLTIHIKNLNCW